MFRPRIVVYGRALKRVKGSGTSGLFESTQGNAQHNGSND